MSEPIPFHQWKDELRASEAPKVRTKDEYYSLYGYYCEKVRKSMSPFQATWLVVDTETTGIDPVDHRVCQIAGVWVQGNQIIHRFESLVNPGRHIPPEASAVHHLTDAHVADALPFRDVLFSMLASGPEFDAWAAHNADFDFGFIPTDKPVLCTMKLARKLWDAPHYSNQYLRYALKLPVPDVEGMPAHSALPDALVTSRLLMREFEDLSEKHYAKYGSGITSLIQWVNEPNLIETVAFGKYKGQKWSSVPKDYLRWAKENVNMDKDLEFTIDHYLKVK